MRTFSDFYHLISHIQSGFAGRGLIFIICVVILLLLGSLVAVHYPLETTFLVLLAASIFTIGRQ